MMLYENQVWNIPSLKRSKIVGHQKAMERCVMGVTRLQRITKVTGIPLKNEYPVDIWGSNETPTFTRIVSQGNGCSTENGTKESYPFGSLDNS